MHFVKEQEEKGEQGKELRSLKHLFPFLSAIARESQLATQTKEMQGESWFV